MQIMPPPVKSTVVTPKSPSSWGSRRRLFFLVATAAIASTLGMALAGSFRFQVLTVGQAPLFKPQQDFPPLAEWPPELPSAQELDHQESSWDEAPPPQLVYNERSTSEIESHDVYQQASPALEEPPALDISHPPDIIDAATPRIENIPQNLVDEVSDDEALVPVISTNPDNLDHAPGHDGLSIEVDTSPEAVNSPRFDKQPASEAQFIELPNSSDPEEPIPSPEILPID